MNGTIHTELEAFLSRDAKWALVRFRVSDLCLLPKNFNFPGQQIMANAHFASHLRNASNSVCNWAFLLKKNQIDFGVKKPRSMNDCVILLNPIFCYLANNLRYLKN